MDKKRRRSLPTTEAMQTELKRVEYRERYKKILKSTFYTLIVVAAIAALIATLVLPVLQISGTSMEPNLNNGEIVLLVKTDKMDRGDLCVFSYSNKTLIKRVIGLPGETVYIKSDGTVLVNGQELSEPYIKEKALGECDIKMPYEVPQDEYFVMGDQRLSSIDSRSSVIGCIKKDQIIGKIFFRIWPLSEISFLK